MTTGQLVTTLDVPLYALLVVIVFLFIVVGFRRLAFSWYDPIFVINAQTIGFSVTLIAYSCIVGSVGVNDLWYFGFSTLSFFLGAYGVQLIIHKLKPKTAHRSVGYFKFDLRLAKTLMFVSTIILMSTIGMRAITVGLPIFSENPDSQKFLANEGGFGVLARVAETLTYANLVLLFYLKRQKCLSKMANLYFLAPLAALFFSGSKSAFLMVYFAYFFSNIYISFLRGEKSNFVSLKIVVLGVLIVFGYAALVMYLSVLSRSNDGESAGNLVIQSLLTRFIGTGEGPYYFFANLKDVIVHSPLDYIQYYVAQPVLAPFRLVDYGRSLGVEIAYTMFGLEKFGPFPTMYVEGWAFFGPVGGVAYCFLIGGLFSYIRYIPLYIRIKSDVLRLLFFCISNLLVLEIGKDMVLFSGYLMNYVVIVPLIFMLSIIILSIWPMRVQSSFAHR